MKQQFSFDEHGIVISNTALVISNYNSGGVKIYDLHYNFVILGIDADGTYLEVEDEGEQDFSLRMDYSLNKYQLEIERITQDGKPVIYASGEAGVECPVFVPLQTFFILARAGESVGIKISGSGYFHVLETYTNREIFMHKIEGVICE